MTMSKKGFFTGLAVGAGLGVLFAPKSGKETREDLKKKANELIEKAKELDAKEVKENIEKKLAEIKAEIKELDKEKAVALAKKQAKKIADKASELVEYVKEKGTPYMEKTADAIRSKSVELTKGVLDKLEKKEPAKATAKKSK